MNQLMKPQVLKHGLVTVFLLIAYFHIVELIGLAHNFELKVLNGVIFGSILFIMLRKERVKSGPKDFNYLDSFSSGMYYSLVVAVLFTSYIMLYLTIINPSFFMEMKEQAMFGQYITLMSIPVAITLEVMGSGFAFTLISLQYLKSRELHITQGH